MQLDLPILVGEPIPILYVQMDGTGVPVVKKETAGRQGKTEGQPAHSSFAVGNFDVVFEDVTEHTFESDDGATGIFTEIENHGGMLPGHAEHAIDLFVV